MSTEDTASVPDLAFSETVVAHSMPPYAGGAVGSGSNEERTPMASAELGLTEAQHWATYLRRMDAMIGDHLARLGLSREELRDGRLPKPEVEATADTKHAVGEVLQGFHRLTALIGEAERDAILPYAEQEVLLALSVLDREIDAGELHLWLRPEAQAILQPADVAATLDRLAARQAIRVRTLIVGRGRTAERFGARTFRFDGCGGLLRLYAAPFRAPTLARI